MPWLDKSYATQLALQPLSVEACQRLLESLLPGQVIPAAVLHSILTRAEGNPFFVEELAQTMLTHGDVSGGLEIPETIAGVLMARLDRLPEFARRLLQIASTLGRTVSVPLARTLWDGPGAIEEALDVLERHEFLYAQVGTAEALYVFKHALTQEVTYNSLPQMRRQVFHTTIAQTLESLHAQRPDEALEQLAYHYGRSTEAAKAIAYLRQFGAKAARSFAHVEAITAYQQALQHVEGLPSRQQDRTRLSLLLDQTFSLAGLLRFRDIHALLVPQQEQLEQLQDPALMSPYYFRLGMTATYLGTYDQSRHYAQRAIEAAQQCHDTATLGMSYYLLGLTHTWSGKFREGLASSRQAVTYLTNTREQHWLGMAYWNVGSNAAFLGEFKTALEALAHTATLGASSEDLRLQHITAMYQGWVHSMQGEFEVGIAMCQHVLTREPDPSTGLGARLYLGIAYLEQGSTIQAIPLLEKVIQRA